jgi:hypothetical protein
VWAEHCGRWQFEHICLCFGDRWLDPTVSENAPLDGTYQTSFTLAELEATPLQHDEINDENWGEFTLTFSGDRVTFTQANDLASYSTSGTLSVQGDAVTLLFDQGENAGETFRFLWSLSGGRSPEAGEG